MTKSSSSLLLFAAMFGGLVWLGHAACFRPAPFDTGWAVELLLLAPLVLVPLTLRVVPEDRESPLAKLCRQLAIWSQMPAALFLVASFAWEQGAVAGLLALPWLLATLLIAGLGLLRLFSARPDPSSLAISFGLMFLAIGGGWTILSRLGMRPLEFDPIIVLLTGIHFHYAGLVLPIVTGLAAKCRGGAVSGLACLAVILSVPLVAAGISTTQLGSGPLLECLAASLMALAGMLCAGMHLSLAWQEKWPAAARLLWGGAGLILTFGMVLALLYGLRPYLPIEGLDIPWMRALHGTANALGFALPALLGWNCVLKKP